MAGTVVLMKNYNRLWRLDEPTMVQNASTCSLFCILNYSAFMKCVPPNYLIKNFVILFYKRSS